MYIEISRYFAILLESSKNSTHLYLMAGLTKARTQPEIRFINLVPLSRTHQLGCFSTTRGLIALAERLGTKYFSYRGRLSQDFLMRRSGVRFLSPAPVSPLLVPFSRYPRDTTKPIRLAPCVQTAHQLRISLTLSSLLRIPASQLGMQSELRLGCSCLVQRSVLR
jgi:hypothetical protein